MDIQAVIPTPDDGGAHRFPQTRWSMVVAAAQTGVPEARGALGELCRLYWSPLYGYVRNRVTDKTEAADLVQAFFLFLMEQGAIARADQLRGSFRSFLMGCLRNFLADAHDRRTAQKRGGHVRIVPFDTEVAERQYLAATDLTPAAQHEQMFDRQWAVSVMRHALDELESELPESARERFEALRPFLVPAETQASYEQVAAQLGESLSTVKSTIHRMRGRYREVLRRQIGRTVSAPHEIDGEIRHLIDVLGAT